MNPLPLPGERHLSISDRDAQLLRSLMDRDTTTIVKTPIFSVDSPFEAEPLFAEGHNTHITFRRKKATHVFNTVVGLWWWWFWEDDYGRTVADEFIHWEPQPDALMWGFAPAPPTTLYIPDPNKKEN